MSYSTDVVVIGAGLAGLMAGWRAAVLGKRVRVLAKGWGATHWHSGCIDVLGYPQQLSPSPCRSPAECVNELIRTRPGHPYELVTIDGLDEALRALQSVCKDAGYPLHGTLSQNWFLPSALGALRPTCLAPETMIAGDLRQDEPMLIVGFRKLRDFYAGLAADNLTMLGTPARGVMLEVESLRERRFLTSPMLARHFESSAFANEVAELVRPHLGDAERVGFPAVLGLAQPLIVKARLEEQLKRRVFEIPTLPPSVAGMRLHHILREAIVHRGGRVFEGMEVVGAELNGNRVTAVLSEAAARQKQHRAAVYLLATGGILGGGIVTDHHGKAREPILGLPLASLPSRGRWFKGDFFDPEGHPIYQIGVTVDRRFRPLGDEGRQLPDNVLAAGGLLAHCDALRERSHEGVAVATGYWAGESAASYETS